MHPPAFRLLPPIGDDQKLPFPTAVSGAGPLGPVPAVPAVQLLFPALCIPPAGCIPYPCGTRSPVGSRQPALPCPALGELCPGREGILPSLWLLPGHLSPALTVLGSISCVLGGEMLGHCLNRPNCEGILHSSVPVSLIQHYCVLGKGVGARCPSPTLLYHCVIIFLHTLCIVRRVLPRFSN